LNEKKEGNEKKENEPNTVKLYSGEI